MYNPKHREALPPRDHTLLRVLGGVDVLPADRLTGMHELVLRCWDEWRTGRAAPARRDIELPAIAAALPHVILWEPDGCGSYRCRLTGTAVDDMIERPLAGLSVDDIPCSRTAELRQDFDMVRERAVIGYAERTLAWAGKPHRAYRLLVMPLLGPAGGVEQLLAVATFHCIPDEQSPL